ncbi:hypothetical protein BRYFOR_07371 [Marvinbryantia formatexigens DSM 14469]|uniref:Spore cortex biosynthesis protein YabQ n=1 Tax=Marvinbryantia formatexigens DSM 14469 TaxID=478749 RepID=C6LFG8_9FIRM|nr:spore cortex biosynthesis protein YabQ [Marvinbryantia formatexigens]EET60553.1 hypothetical protein BRYFOR_07371 [Marvinbryantia formatexigens DSM 14469]UWO25550.1 spore cortex biosynthesis protein YabQ [Marvinbryantia formatexigens DSM 14469]SDG20301.1 spore cortex biosynthesis protein YabQ [Marvinbryantia formatexigens]
MSAVVQQEALFFFVSILTGVFLVWAYDLFRIFRKVVPHHIVAVSIEDLFYWLAVSFIIFGMIFEKNNGALRGYAFVGILLGVWFQYLAEVFFRKIWTKLLKKIRKRGKMSVHGR